MQQISDAQIKGSNYTFQYSAFYIPSFLLNLINYIPEHCIRSFDQIKLAMIWSSFSQHNKERLREALLSN